ncbi:hypothetical protein M569_00743, partial [Genlisea aurea]
LNWRFSQIFGDKLPDDDVQDIDIISAIDFDKSGNHIAVGDRGGRVVVFENNGGKDNSHELTSRTELEKLDGAIRYRPKYRYKTEFQSHEPQFDYLKSIEIEGVINKVRWCASTNRSLSVLSANDKTIKLWWIKELKNKSIKDIELTQPVNSENSLLAEKSYVNGETPYFSNDHSLEWNDNDVSSCNGAHGKISCSEDACAAKCRRVYANAHDFSINSISVNSDLETFISGDELRINLWNLENSNQCFNIIDLKPAVMEDLVEMITGAEFHPFHCNLLAYSSSRGFIRIVDLRKSALCDNNARILKDVDSHGPKSFFTEIIASITDMKFASDGRHIVSRDYMNMKLWDMRMDAGPVATYTIHDSLKSKVT